MSTMLTAHFSWEEVTHSDTAKKQGIDNTVPVPLLNNVHRMAQFMENEVRALLGVPLKVNSWYRCPTLNKAVGGSKTSAHMKGLAVDFDPIGMTLDEAFRKIAGSDLQFDQLIIERTKSGADWIHIGLSEGTPRREVLKASGETLGGHMNYERVSKN